jgi:hypothetical protein
MRMTQSNLKSDALLVDKANIAQTATFSPTITTESYELYVEGSDYVDILMKVTGEAAATGTVTFSWILYNTKTIYPTVASFTSTIVMTSNTITKRNQQFLVTGYKYLRLLSILNGDAAKDATAVNAYVTSIG